MWILGQQIWNGIVTGTAYSVFAMGLTLVFGMMQVINMAHGELFMLGAMLLFTLTTSAGLPFLPALLISTVAVGCFGVVFNRIVIQPLVKEKPLNVMLSTMAISVVLVNIATIFWGPDTRIVAGPLSGDTELGGIIMPRSTILLLLTGLAALAALHLFLTRTMLGRMMRATAQDRTGATLIGINVSQIYTLTVAISAALAALAGGIVGPIWSASPIMGQAILLKGFAVVIIGGMGNTRGCVLTGLLLGVTEALFAQYVSTFYRDAYAFGLLVVVCLIKPQGLFKSA